MKTLSESRKELETTLRLTKGINKVNGIMAIIERQDKQHINAMIEEIKSILDDDVDEREKYISDKIDKAKLKHIGEMKCS